jgi:hypothetical protein
VSRRRVGDGRALACLALTTVLVIAAAACTNSERDADSVAGGGAQPRVDSGASAAEPGSRGTTMPALVFDPATVKVGDTVGALRVARMDIAKAADDMGYVGNIRFEGEVTISGARMTHPDYPDVQEICMSIDSTSVQRLPRFPADQRRPWLCFDPRDDAARQLGAAGTRGELTVVIDDYQTVRHFTDAYDTARLVRVVDDRRER